MSRPISVKETAYFTMFGRCYHIQECPVLNRVKGDNIVWTGWINTLVERRLVPCKICNPEKRINV